MQSTHLGRICLMHSWSRAPSSGLAPSLATAHMRLARLCTSTRGSSENLHASLVGQLSCRAWAAPRPASIAEPDELDVQGGSSSKRVHRAPSHSCGWACWGITVLRDAAVGHDYAPQPCKLQTVWIWAAC